MKEKIEIKLGQRLKELREEKGYTQKQLSDMLGIHSVTYLHYEKSQREPPLLLLAEMASLFDVTIDYILGLEEY